MKTTVVEEYNLGEEMYGFKRQIIGVVEPLLRENLKLRKEVRALRCSLSRRTGTMEWSDVPRSDNYDVEYEDDGVLITWTTSRAEGDDEDDGNEYEHELIIEEYPRGRYTRTRQPIQLFYDRVNDYNCTGDTKYFDSIEAALVYARMNCGLPPA